MISDKFAAKILAELRALHPDISWEVQSKATHASIRGSRGGISHGMAVACREDESSATIAKEASFGVCDWLDRKLA